MIGEKEAYSGLVLSLIKRHGEKGETVLARIANLPATLDVEMVHDLQMKELFEAVLEYSKENTAVPMSLAAELSGMDEFDLIQKSANIDPEAVNIYADTVMYWHKKYLLRQASQGVTQIIEDEDPDAAIDKITELYASLAKRDDGAVRTIQESTEIAHQQLLEMHDQIRSGQPRICFPWDGLNGLVPFLLRGDVILWSAQSKAGKSSSINQLYDHNACRGFTGALFHLEDTPLKIFIRRAARFMTELSRTGYSNLVDQYRLLAKNSQGKTGMALTEEELETVIALKQLISDRMGDSFEIHCPGWTVERIVNTWRRIHTQRMRSGRGGIDFVVIDYVNKIDHGKEYEASVGQPNALGRALDIIKAAAEKMGTIVFVVQQENEEGKTYNSRQTYHKSQVWVSIQRERISDDVLSNKGKFVVKAANFGQTGAIEIKLHPRWMGWEEL